MSGPLGDGGLGDTMSPGSGTGLPVWRRTTLSVDRGQPDREGPGHTGGPIKEERVVVSRPRVWVSSRCADGVVEGRDEFTEERAPETGGRIP